MNEVDKFEIPDDLAKKLSDLLIQQSIRERALDRALQSGDESSYERIEVLLGDIVGKIEVIKNRITNEFVPKEYQLEKYNWVYNNYEIDKNKVTIMSK